MLQRSGCPGRHKECECPIDNERWVVYSPRYVHNNYIDRLGARRRGDTDEDNDEELTSAMAAQSPSASSGGLRNNAGGV